MKRVVPCVLAGALSMLGCAAPTFEASWYLLAEEEKSDRTPVTSPRPGLYVAVINRSAVAQRLSRLRLNAAEDDESAGWCAGLPGDGLTLAPGGMLVRHADDFRDRHGEGLPDCHLPVAVRIDTPQGPLGAAVAGRLPNLMPAGWLRCPEFAPAAGRHAGPISPLRGLPSEHDHADTTLSRRDDAR